MIPDIPDYEDISDEEKVDSNAYLFDISQWNSIFTQNEIKQALRDLEFKCPSQVQKEAIPVITEGKDILCQARSGMGKTAVYIIGVLNRLRRKQQGYTQFNCLVICHSRELAHQAFRDFRKFSKYFKDPVLRIDCFFGGFSADNDRARLSKQQNLPHIVIGTPGRLKSLYKDGLIKMDNVQFFVIDECDKVMSSPSMMPIIQQFSYKMKNPQVIMMSATIDLDTIKRSKSLLSDPKHVFIDTGKLTLSGIFQFNVMVLEKDKREHLMSILDKIKFTQGVIFMNKIDRAQKLTDLLAQKLFNPICIHSKMAQEDRIINYDRFKANKTRILIATDLFGRGIDVQKVNLVINYDLPHDKAGYFHRIGRAGRFNKKGIAINFLCPFQDESQIGIARKDVLVMKQIEEDLQTPIPLLPVNFDYKDYI